MTTESQEEVRQKLWSSVVEKLCDDRCGGIRAAIQSADFAVAEFDRRFKENEEGRA